MNKNNIYFTSKEIRILIDILNYKIKKHKRIYNKLDNALVSGDEQ